MQHEHKGGGMGRGGMGRGGMGSGEMSDRENVGRRRRDKREAGSEGDTATLVIKALGMQLTAGKI